MEEEVHRNHQCKVEVEAVGRQCLQLWGLRRGCKIGGRQLYLPQLRKIQEVGVGRDKSSWKNTVWINICLKKECKRNTCYHWRAQLSLSRNGNFGREPHNFQISMIVRLDGFSSTASAIREGVKGVLRLTYVPGESHHTRLIYEGCRNAHIRPQSMLTLPTATRHRILARDISLAELNWTANRILNAALPTISRTIYKDDGRPSCE